MFKNLIKDISIHNFFKYDKEKYENFLDDPLCHAGKSINKFLLILVVLLVLTISLETVGDNFIRFYTGFFVVNLTISLIFFAEYFYRLLRARKKFNFIINPFNIVDLVSFLPFFIEILFSHIIGVNIMSALRLLSTLRLFDFVKLTPILFWFLKSIRNYGREYKVAFSLMAIVLILVSIIVYFFERGINPMFSSIPNAFWWGIVTMATVGYGDMYPITPLGKLFGSLIIILGPLLIAVVSSITILIFMDVIEVQKKVNNILEMGNYCPRCKHMNPTGSNYCNKCGGQM